MAFLNKYSPFDIESRLRDLVDIKLGPNQNPIVFCNDYEITFAGMEKWYPLDTCKGSNVFRILKELGLLTEADVVRPNETTFDQLSLVHTKNFLENINLVHVIEGLYNQPKDSRRNIMGFPDLPSLGLLPSFIINNRLLRPFRFQVGGSVLAVKLALEIGWSINLGGGFTHCYPRRSGSFSPYSDVTLAVNFLLGKVERVMIIDLSAQQCNGPERSFMYNKRVHILDVYNRDIYPLDGFARRGISIRGELENQCLSRTYLDMIRSKLEDSLDCFKPDFVLYIAGMDVLSGDMAGCMNVSIEATVERDQLIFLKLRSRGIPVSMFLGGGFCRDAHSAVAKSIVNLHNFGLITISSSYQSQHVSKDQEDHKADGTASDLNRFASFSTGDLRLVNGIVRDEEKSLEDLEGLENPDVGSEYPSKGFIYKSKTFMGSLMGWTGWNKPQAIYQMLSRSDSLEDAD